MYAQAYQAAIGQGATAAQAQAFATNYATTNAPAQTRAITGTPAVFSNTSLFPYLTAEMVKGMVVYHIMGVRAFNNNLPTTRANFPTLLNSVVTAHPGLGLQATFTGPMVSAASVKGLVNATPANILINPTPGSGSSDQNYLNGVLHKIDQVLMPQ